MSKKPKTSTGRPKLQTLQPTVKLVDLRIGTPLKTASTQRIRGRAGVDRRRRWLAVNPLCAHCLLEGRVRAGDEVDHVIPLHAGGADDASNLQTLCSAHHKTKTAAEARGGPLAVAR